MNEISENEYSLFDLENECDVWVVCTNRPQNELKQYFKILDDDELERYHSFYFIKDKLRYLVSRGFLKNLLAKYVEVDSKKISINTNRYGKPFLEKSQNEHGIQFSIAHSNEIITFAITRNRSVGIDIEYIPRKVDFLNIASHFFTEREKSVLAALSESRRREVFYKFWTGKEALIKAIGEEPPMDFLNVELSNQCARATFIDGQSDPSRWILKPLFPIEEYVGTLVIEQKHPLNLESLNIIQARAPRSSTRSFSSPGI